MADENLSQQASEGAPEEKPVTVPAPEGWDEAFGADAPKPTASPEAAQSTVAQEPWQPKDEGVGAYGAAPGVQCGTPNSAQPQQPGAAPYAAAGGFGAQPPQNPSGQAWQQPAPAGAPIPTTAYAKSCLSAGWADCKQPGFWKKTAFMGLIELVPILNFVNQGYMLEWSKEVPFGGRTSLPQKVVTGRNFEIGFYAFVISLVFSLVAGLAGGILGWIPLIGWIATVVIGFLVAMFTYILNLRMAMRSQLGEGFKVGDAWKAIKRDWSGLLWAILAPGLIAAGVILVVSLVYTFLAVLFLIPVIGMTAYPDPAYMVSAIVGGGLGFALLTLVFAYICSWAGVVSQLVGYRAAAHWVARYAGEWTYLV